MNRRIAVYWFIIVAALVAYFPLFLHLDAFPLEMYDEARRAMNAMGMMEADNFIVTTYDGKPDMWGTKPPLLIYCQAISMYLFGISELSVRLPSALAGLFTICFLIWYFWKKRGDLHLGIASALVLLTTPGYIAKHVTRTGDFDALLVLFVTIYALLFYEWIIKKQDKASVLQLTLISLFVFLATMTKGVAGLLFAPGLILSVFVFRKAKQVFTDVKTYVAVLTLLFFIIGFYVLRDYYNPGYIDAVMKNELGGRFMQGLEGHKNPFGYYFNIIAKFQFRPWVFFIPFGLLIGIMSSEYRKLTIYCFIVSSSFLLVISSAQTKLDWYDAPVFPILSILCGIGVWRLWEVLMNSHHILEKWKLGGMGLLFVFAVYGSPYCNIIKKIYKPKVSAEHNAFGFFIKEVVKNHDKFQFAHHGYNSHAHFYQILYSRKGYDVGIHGPKDLDIGSKFVFCEKRVRDKLRKNHSYEVIFSNNGCSLVRITK